MTLYLQRHGIAAWTKPGGADFDRQLTMEGRSRLKETAEVLRDYINRPVTILHSPYVRARETAEVLSDVLGITSFEEPELACGCTLGKLREILHTHDDSANIWVVGHQPELGDMIYTLTGQPIPMNPGTFVHLELENPASSKAQLVATL